MIITSKKVESYLERTRVTLESIKDDTEVKVQIAAYGYTDARLDEGVALRDEAASIYTALLTTRGEQAKTSFAVDVKKADVAERFSFLAEIFRIAFHDTPELIKELGLEGRRKGSLPALIQQTTTVYTNARTKQYILDHLVGFDLTAETFQTDLDEVEALHELHKQHVYLKGECQRLVQERDRKLAQLKRFMRQLKTVLLMLYKENPQTLERLGIFVRNQRRSAVNTEPPADTTETTAPTASEETSGTEQTTATETDPQTDPQATPQS